MSMKVTKEQFIGVTYEELLAENAKLRELCVKALEWLRWAGGITCPPEVPDEFADELRELGVEVD
jgi:NADPH-dependent 2,4-dienoyl-CoA reductase/sulfur reductase-like enzyme